MLMLFILLFLFNTTKACNLSIQCTTRVNCFIDCSMYYWPSNILRYKIIPARYIIILGFEQEWYYDILSCFSSNNVDTCIFTHIKKLNDITRMVILIDVGFCLKVCIIVKIHVIDVPHKHDAFKKMKFYFSQFSVFN